MEALYSKLYNKYEIVKKKRLSELDEIGKDQEVKFLNYVSAAEEMIKFLTCENEKLCAQVSELRTEVVSIRSTKDEECARYKKLLVEESQKNKMLSEEVERLQNRQDLSLHSENAKNVDAHVITAETAQATPTDVTSYSTRRKTRKRTREATARMKVKSPAPNDENAFLAIEAPISSSEGAFSSGHLENGQQPQCCRRVVQGSGVDVEDSGHSNCQFQTLIEYLLGMKLCADYQTDRKCILALHESSGYSFSLTWVKNASGEEQELIYRASRLGTFEMVAPEWMRSVLMFSTSMWPIFFERLARVIKMQC